MKLSQRGKKSGTKWHNVWLNKSMNRYTNTVLEIHLKMLQTFVPTQYMISVFMYNILPHTCKINVIAVQNIYEVKLK